MEALFVYFLKMILTSTVMYGYYLLFLKDRTFHHYNRFYLVFLVVMSLSLPLLKVSYFTIELDERLMNFLTPIQNYGRESESFDFFSIYSIIGVFLGLVSLFFIFRLMRSVYAVIQLKNKYTKESIKGISFYTTALENAPFSFFKNLFWKESLALDSDLGRQILKHEMVHIEQKHSYDKVFVEVIQGLFWFNPMFYLVKKELNLIHEYLADNKAVKNKDTKAFAQMLLQSHFSVEALPMTHPFINSHLKKRLNMLQKSKTKYAYLRKLAVLPVVFSMSFVLLVNAKNKEIKEVNKEVKIALSEIKKDTIGKTKITSEKITVEYDFNELKSKEDHAEMKSAFADMLKESKPSDTFMVEGHKVGPSKFKKFIEENYQDKRFRIAYTKNSQGKGLYRASFRKAKPNVIQLDNGNSLEVSASLSDIDIPNQHIINEDNAIYFVNDQPANKKEYLKFVKENDGKNGFELFKSTAKRGAKSIYSAAMADMSSKANEMKDRHTKFMKSMKKRIQSHSKPKQEIIDVSIENNINADKKKSTAHATLEDIKTADSLKNINDPSVISVGAHQRKPSIYSKKNKYVAKTIYLDDNNEQEIIAIQNDQFRPVSFQNKVVYYVNGKEVSENIFNKLKTDDVKSITVIKNKHTKTYKIEITTKR